MLLLLPGRVAVVVVLSKCLFSLIYLSLSPLVFASLLSLAICKASYHFAFLLSFFIWMVLFTASCTVLQTSVHHSSDTLFKSSNPLNPFVASAALSQWICLRSCLTGLEVFTTFFSQPEFCYVNLMIRATVNSMSCFFLTIYRFSIFSYKDCNQFDFGIDHLVKTMCKTVSCAVEKGQQYHNNMELLRYNLLTRTLSRCKHILLWYHHHNLNKNRFYQLQNYVWFLVI